MKEFAWLQNHQSLAAVEAIFQRGAAILPSQEIDADAWRFQAVDLSGVTPPEKLSEAAHTLLTHIPFDAAEDAVRRSKKGQERALMEVKAIRRLCFVARDLAIITTEGELPKSYRPLARACFNMGEVLDTEGSRGINESLKYIGILQKKKNLPEPAPSKTQEGLHIEVTRRLQSAGPLIAGVTGNLDAERIHDARKDFRRAAGFVVLTAASLGSKWSAFSDLAADGAALNRRFGQIKDAALAAPESEQSVAGYVTEETGSGLLAASRV